MLSSPTSQLAKTKFGHSSCQIGCSLPRAKRICEKWRRATRRRTNVVTLKRLRPLKKTNPLVPLCPTAPNYRTKLSKLVIGRMNSTRGRGLPSRCRRYRPTTMSSSANPDVLRLNAGRITCKVIRLSRVTAPLPKAVRNRSSLRTTFTTTRIHMCAPLTYNNFVSGACATCLLLPTIPGLWIRIALLLKVLMMVRLANLIRPLTTIVFATWSLFRTIMRLLSRTGLLCIMVPLLTKIRRPNI